jgi:hypothetical protein
MIYIRNMRKKIANIFGLSALTSDHAGRFLPAEVDVALSNPKWEYTRDKTVKARPYNLTLRPPHSYYVEKRRISPVH